MHTLKTKQLLLAVIGIVTLVGCSPKPATSYVITGQIQGLEEGTGVQLIPVSHKKEKPLTDTVVVDGKFVFKGIAEEEPRAVHLVVGDSYAGLMMVENGKIDITGKAEKMEEKYKISDLTIKGSPLTDYYHKLYSTKEQLNQLYDDYHAEYKDLLENLGQARIAKDKTKTDSLRSSDEYKAFEQAEHNFFETVSNTYKQVVEENKETFWGPLMMITFTSYLRSSDEDRQWYETLSQTAKDSYYGQKVHEEIYPVGKIGSKAPPFTVKDEQGKDLTLADLCKEKKYVLIDFWASWCAPCRKEIPNLKREYVRHGAKGFDIVSISIDQKREDWEKALKEEKLPWHNFIDENGIADTYGVQLIPTTYLVNNEGVIVAENLRGEDFSNKLNELFAE
ncbi:TlpA disulfide reductase family protein [Proteiniphilum sp. UBA5384]|uniref:TlpA disulfide reductase family protein n=1 Tax=Proteiniphilum sp. UBA5384 TaxID=1947279 RepID=UPI0025ED42D8|nr:TlpA disulfide reductase family protein [Proteiniphilum sp. UBA5384]